MVKVSDKKYAEVMRDCYEKLEDENSTLRAELATVKAERDGLRELAQHIADVTPAKMGGACPICGTYTHKAWCWYPGLLQATGCELDEHDTKYLKDRAKLPAAPSGREE